jgi:hypothetical protein
MYEARDDDAKEMRRLAAAERRAGNSDRMDAKTASKYAGSEAKSAEREDRKSKGKHIHGYAIGESAVPGKPAEKLGAVTSIPKDEQDAARQRTLAKAAAMRAKKGITKEELELDESGQTPKATAAYGALANKRRNTPASEYPQRGAKKVAVKSAERHMSRSQNPDAGDRGKKSTKPDWNSGKRRGMTQSDRDHARGEAEYGHTGYDPDWNGPASGPGGKPKGKKLERQRATGVSKEQLELELRAHLRERALDASETKEKESVYKAIKPSKLAKSYPEKSPKELKSLRYAISTAQAKKNMDTSRSDKRYGVEG